MTVRTVFGVLFGLLLSVASVALVAWLLWWLWTRREEEAAKSAAIEIEVEEPPAEAPVEEAEAEEGEAEEAEVEEAAAAESTAVEATDEALPAGEVPAEEAEAEAEEEAAAEEPPPPPDDLKVVEGIGPKIESVLQAAGITTYAQLAAADPAHISEVLEASDPRLRRLADPTTWPEQASLAAAGRWDEFEALKETLKGGRRVK